MTPTSPTPPSRAQRRAAAAAGVYSCYVGHGGERRMATAAGLEAALAALEAPIGEGLRIPVAVAWDGAPPVLRWPEGVTAPGTAELEDPGGRTSSVPLDAVAPGRLRPRTGPLALGLHQLRCSGLAEPCTVISAPRRAHAAGSGAWGVFAPVATLRSATDRGCGTYLDLGRLGGWVRGLGGHLTATLPLLETHHALGDASPYRPLSRRAWSTQFLDPEALPGVADCPAAQQLLADSDFRQEAERLARLPEVDTEARARHVRAVARRVALQGARSMQESPWQVEYAAFRTAQRRWGPRWRRWPPRARAGRLDPEDRDPVEETVEVYMQTAARAQLAAAARVGLLLDLPLGVHPDGFDAWQRPELWVSGFSVGAPPDDFHGEGQRWGLEPLHPGASRHEGHESFFQALLTQTLMADALRVDHIMGFHRQFWLPEGRPAEDGVYVRYPAEELYALVCLASTRGACAIFGEDLGTVPPAVRPAMARHGLGRCFVGEFGAQDAGGSCAAPPGSLAMIDNHDLPPFAAWLAAAPRGDEEQPGPVAILRADLGLATEAASSASELRDAWLAALGAGGAAVVLATLEDLWLEEQPHNRPGTTDAANWRRRAGRSLDDAMADRTVVAPLARLAAARRGARAARS